MKNLLSWTLVMSVIVLLSSGCGKKAEERADSSSTPSKIQIPANDPGRNIDENFLVEQTAKKTQLEKTIKSFWNDSNGDSKVVRKMILSRKGELLTTKRNIRKSMLFTDAEKDSLIRPLDQESMGLSTELIAFSE
jgi:hypothetical protein